MNKQTHIIQTNTQARTVSMTQFASQQQNAIIQAQQNQKIPSPLSYNKPTSSGQTVGGIIQFNQITQQSPLNQIAPPQFIVTPTRITTSPDRIRKTNLSDYNIIATNPIIVNPITTLPQGQYQITPTGQGAQKQYVFNIQPESNIIRQNRYFSATQLNQYLQPQQVYSPVTAQTLNPNQTPSQNQAHDHNQVQTQGQTQTQILLQQPQIFSNMLTNPIPQFEQAMNPLNPGSYSPQLVTIVSSPLRPQISSRKSSFSPQPNKINNNLLLINSPPTQNLLVVNSPQVQQVAPLSTTKRDQARQLSPQPQLLSNRSQNNYSGSRKATSQRKDNLNVIEQQQVIGNGVNINLISLNPNSTPKREQIKDYLLKNSPQNQNTSSLQNQELKSGKKAQFQINNISSKSKQDKYKQVNLSNYEKQTINETIITASKTQSAQTSQIKPAIDVNQQINEIVKTVNDILNAQIDKYYQEEKRRITEVKTTNGKIIIPPFNQYQTTQFQEAVSKEYLERLDQNEKWNFQSQNLQINQQIDMLKMIIKDLKEKLDQKEVLIQELLQVKEQNTQQKVPTQESDKNIENLENNLKTKNNTDKIASNERMYNLVEDNLKKQQQIAELEENIVQLKKEMQIYQSQQQQNDKQQLESQITQQTQLQLNSAVQAIENLQKDKEELFKINKQLEDQQSNQTQERSQMIQRIMELEEANQSQINQQQNTQ